MSIIPTTYLKVDVSSICIEVILIFNNDLGRPIKNIRVVKIYVWCRFNG